LLHERDHEPALHVELIDGTGAAMAAIDRQKRLTGASRAR
jgi:hypothetical protein